MPYGHARKKRVNVIYDKRGGIYSFYINIDLLKPQQARFYNWINLYIMKYKIVVSLLHIVLAG